MTYQGPYKNLNSGQSYMNHQMFKSRIRSGEAEISKYRTQRSGNIEKFKKGEINKLVYER